MGESGSRLPTGATEPPSGRVVPDHVPSELVVEFEHYDDPAYADDPFAVFDRVAARAPPVFWSPLLGGFWVVTRYDDVFEVYRNNRLFSSAQIGVPAAVMPYKLRPLQSDPPEHKSYRRLLEPLFARGAMEALKPRISRISRELLDGFKHRGACEFIGEFARFLPNRVFMALLGLPEERFETLMAWERALLHGETPEVRFHGMRSIENFVAVHFVERRGAPRRDDLTDRIVHGELDGRPLTDDELKSVGFLIYIAGLDTVQAMMGWAYRHLALNQEDQWTMRASEGAGLGGDSAPARDCRERLDRFRRLHVSRSLHEEGRSDTLHCRVRQSRPSPHSSRRAERRWRQAQSAHDVRGRSAHLPRHAPCPYRA